MPIKKIAFLIIFILFLFIPSLVHADLVPMECMSFNDAKPPAYCMYGNYKGPLYPRIFSINPLLGLSINFTLVTIATITLSFVKYKKIEKKTVLFAIGITILGLIIDSVALSIANGVHNYYYDRFLYPTEFLIDSFFNALFISSLILLFVAYSAIYTLIYGKKITKNVVIVSLLLALINNPYWFLKYI